MGVGAGFLEIMCFGQTGKLTTMRVESVAHNDPIKGFSERDEASPVRQAFRHC